MFYQTKGRNLLGIWEQLCKYCHRSEYGEGGRVLRIKANILVNGLQLAVSHSFHLTCCDKAWHCLQPHSPGACSSPWLSSDCVATTGGCRVPWLRSKHLPPHIPAFTVACSNRACRASGAACAGFMVYLFV